MFLNEVLGDDPSSYLERFSEDLLLERFDIMMPYEQVQTLPLSRFPPVCHDS